MQDGQKLTFEEALNNPDTLSVTWELVPGRGAFESSQENILKMAEQAAKGDMVHAVTITDNPGGTPAILASSLGMEIKKLGMESLIHFTCKDKNRNGIHSELYSLERAELHNLLVMTGDYPTLGYTGKPKSVFDMDAVQTLKLLESLNEGEKVPTRKGQNTLKKTSFFSGAVVSPFKTTEAEQMTQYYKLQKKIDAGASFIITQLGYDARKFHELRQFMDINNIKIPLIGNIYVLSLGTAKLMNRNMLPGCVVTDKLLKVLQKEKEECNDVKEAQLLRAAKLYAILKGLRYDGVNIGGHGLKYNEVEYIIKKGEELIKDWKALVNEFEYPVENGFYYFEKDEHTLLNTNNPINRKKTGPGGLYPSYKMFSLVHHIVFDEKAPLYKPMKAASKAIDKSFIEKPLTMFEYMAKTMSNGCQKCGDCAMMELAYVCPMSQCPKQQRNGPCGGSADGWCEVYPKKRKCMYVAVYNRLKKHKNEEKIRRDYFKPCNWDLYNTSSWINYFCGRH